MGKSGKKSGKKGSGKDGSGKKGKKKKRSAEPDMTLKEALLAYQINIKEKALDEVLFEIKVLEDENARNEQRNKNLKEEQISLMKNLLKTTKENEKKKADQEMVTKEQVILEMKDNWKLRREHEELLVEMRESLAAKDMEILTEKQLRNQWIDFRDRGQYELEKQIKLLEQTLVDIQTTFENMTGQMKQSMEKAKEEIDKNTSELLDKQKYLATEKAIARMDKYSRREVIDNDWLTREVEIHQNETENLMKVLESLEEENLQLLSELFQCQIADLQVSRKFFMTQLASDENAEEDAVLEVDLKKLGPFQDNSQKFGPKHPNGRSLQASRPKSAIQKEVEDRVFSSKYHTLARNEKEKHHANFVDKINYDGSNGREGSADGDPFYEYIHLDDDDFDDFLKLGPLEMKMLNLHGDRLPIHKPDTPSKEELRAKNYHPDVWPVTQTMLVDTLNLSRTAASNPTAMEIASK